jgi:large subunit ribosomal protein L17
MAVIELVEELQVAATTAPAKKAARKATAQQDKVEALAREDEAPASTSTAVGTEATTDQDAEPPVSASGDKGAEGPGDKAEGEDTPKA